MEANDSLDTSVERTLEDIGGGASDADHGADAEGGDSSYSVVHRIIPNVTVFAVNDDRLIDQLGDSVTSLVYHRPPASAPHFLRRPEQNVMTHIKTSQRDYLRLANTGNRHESHQRERPLAELVEQSQTGVLHLGGVGGSDGGSGHFGRLEVVGVVSG